MTSLTRLPLSAIAAATLLSLSGCAGLNTLTPDAPGEGGGVLDANQSAYPAVLHVPPGHRYLGAIEVTEPVQYRCMQTGVDQNNDPVYGWVSDVQYHTSKVVDRASNLFDRPRVGGHSGSQYMWRDAENNDGVVMQPVATWDRVPLGTAPWQLLKTQQRAGQSRWARLSYMQLVNTQGWTPPTTLCGYEFQGLLRLVPAKGTYRLWEPAGSTLPQAAAQSPTPPKPSVAPPVTVPQTPPLQAPAPRVTAPAPLPPAATGPSSSGATVQSVRMQEGPAAASNSPPPVRTPMPGMSTPVAPVQPTGNAVQVRPPVVPQTPPLQSAPTSPVSPVGSNIPLYVPQTQAAPAMPVTPGPVMPVKPTSVPQGVNPSVTVNPPVSSGGATGPARPVAPLVVTPGTQQSVVVTPGPQQPVVVTPGAQPAVTVTPGPKQSVVVTPGARQPVIVNTAPTPTPKPGAFAPVPPPPQLVEVPPSGQGANASPKPYVPSSQPERP